MYVASLSTEIKLDNGAGGPPLQPTITVEDFDKPVAAPSAAATNGKPANGNGNGAGVKVPSADAPPTTVADLNGQPMPGSMPTGPAPAIPDWYRVGWRAVSAIDKPLAEGEERERGIIAMFIDDMYYGQWYHNAGIIFFVSSSYI